MIIIILSSMALAAEDPINDNSEWNNYLDVVDNVFTVIFAIEMILKVNNLHNQTVQFTEYLFHFFISDNRFRSDITSRIISQRILERNGCSGRYLRVHVVHISERVTYQWQKTIFSENTMIYNDIDID